MPKKIVIKNPWSGEMVERDISGLTPAQLEAYPLDEGVCEEIAPFACSTRHVYIMPRISGGTHPPPKFKLTHCLNFALRDVMRHGLQ